jgi:hypothetical protein
VKEEKPQLDAKAIIKARSDQIEQEIAAMTYDELIKEFASCYS